MPDMNEEQLQSKPATKTPLIVGGVIVALVILIGGIVGLSKMMGKPAAPAATPIAKKKILAPENVIAVSDRPYVQINPTDIHNIEIQINTVKKPADSVDYEIEYQTDSSLEGAQGSIQLANLPAKALILLGSCSAGGKCRYHTGVQGGSMTLTFGGTENYTLKQEWSYIVNLTKGTQFSSKDAKFQVESKDMANNSIVLIYNSPGYPGTLPGTALSDPYSMTSVSPLKGQANLTMRALEAAPTAEIVGWNGKSWQEFPSKVNDKTVTAMVDLMPLYMIVKK